MEENAKLRAELKPCAPEGGAPAWLEGLRSEQKMARACSFFNSVVMGTFPPEGVPTASLLRRTLMATGTLAAHSSSYQTKSSKRCYCRSSAQIPRWQLCAVRRAR